MIFAALFPLLSLAHVLQDDVSSVSKSRFSFSTVCQKMVAHESPLIEPLSGTELDCMGKKVQVSDFCEKELAQDPYYLRGWVDADTKEVVCQSGKQVIFKYLCVKLADRQLCERPEKEGCIFIGNKLARRLHNVHASFTKNDKGIRQLNCYFDVHGKP